MGNHARGTGRTRPAKSPARVGGDPRRTLHRADPRHRVEDAQGYGALRCRRARAARCDDRRHAQAAAGIPEGKRHRHRRQRIGDQRRRGRTRADGATCGRSARSKTARPARLLGPRRRRPAVHGNRPGAVVAQGARARRAAPGPDRRRRGKRGLRRAGDRRNARPRARSDEGESERIRHLDRASGGRDRRDDQREGGVRAAALGRALRTGDDVHRRRPGDRCGIRADVIVRRQRAGRRRVQGRGAPLRPARAPVKRPAGTKIFCLHPILTCSPIMQKVHFYLIFKFF